MIRYLACLALASCSSLSPDEYHVYLERHQGDSSGTIAGPAPLVFSTGQDQVGHTLGLQLTWYGGTVESHRRVDTYDALQESRRASARAAEAEERAEEAQDTAQEAGASDEPSGGLAGQVFGQENLDRLPPETLVLVLLLGALLLLFWKLRTPKSK